MIDRVHFCGVINAEKKEVPLIMEYPSLKEFSNQLPAKLIRPKLQGAYPRIRLFDMFLQKTDSSAWWICGPAGSGKTTLVNTYLEYCNIPCIWYEMEKSDSDIASFFYYLGMAVESHFPEDSPELPLMTSEYFQGIPVFTRRFFELLCSQINRPFAIILDNYQEVREETMLHEILCNAISVVSTQVTFFVCSRQEPPAELIVPLSRCSLNLLGWNEIKLEKEEAQSIASLVTDKQISEDDFEQLYFKTDGWVTGLLLLLRRSRFENIEPRMLSRYTPQEIFDFFGVTLFKELDPDVQDVLIHLSHVSRISADTAKKLAGKEAPDILKELFRQNAFIYRSFTDVPIFFFHPLFKEFLQNQCSHRLRPEKLVEIQSKSAKAMFDEGRFEEAIQLYLMAGQDREAAGIILSQASELAKQGRFQTLSQWIDSLPEKTVNVMPWMDFWKGVCMVPYGPGRGKPYFKKALVEFETLGDPVGSYLSLSGLIDVICFEANDFSQVDACIDKYHEFHERWGSIEAPEIQLRITSAMLNAMVVRRSNSPEITFWEEKAWHLVRTIEDATVTLQLFIGLLTLKNISGDFAGAKNVLDRFRDATWIKQATLPFLFLQNLHSSYSWSVGRFEEGLEYARNGMEVEKKTGIRLLNSALRTHAACSAMGSGNMALAKKYFDQIAPMIKHQGNWIQALYHCMRSWYELMSGNRREARFHAWLCYEKSQAAGCTMNMSMTHGALAVILYENGEYMAAAEHLDMGFEWSSRFKNPVFDFFGWLLRARFALYSRDESAAEHSLRRGFGIGREHNFRYFNHWLPKMMARLCVEALKRKIEKAYVQSLIREHRLIPPEPPVFINEWPWYVRLYSLGGFRLEIDDETVTFSGKAQKRPLSLLKYLLANNGKSVASDTIQDMLWPDADGDAANNAYTTTLHRLRKLLGNKRILYHSQGRLSFNQDLVWTDLQAFDHCLKAVENCFNQEKYATVAALQEMLDRILDIYRGPFLEGEMDAWTVPMRKNIESRFVSALHRIGSAMERAGEYESALICFRRGLEADPLIESLYEHQIKILCRMGKKTEAMLLYSRCRSILRSSLGVSPSLSFQQHETGPAK
jgi:DNA-binding SARP family transcriptional activator